MGRRAAFDPTRSYEAARNFRWKGQVVSEGEAFTDRGDMRRFRQLYDGRFLRMTEAVAGNVPLFDKMSVAELRQWLIDHGEPNLAHPRATQSRLIERCRRIFMQEQEDPDGISTAHADPERSSEGVQEPAPPRSAPAGDRVRRERIR